jgi:hypothetical protein
MKNPNKHISNSIKKIFENGTTKDFLKHNSTLLYHSDAANHAKEYMQQIYTSEPISSEALNKLKEFAPPISNNTKEQLNAPFTNEEISQAIQHTPEKTPGPSGIPAKFFKLFSLQLTPVLTQIANFSLQNGSTNEYFLKGNIIFIPKKDKNPEIITNLRPITLLEISRKIITKAMTLRLKNALIESDKVNQSIINNNQTCHPNRNMSDNIITLQLIQQYSKTEKKDIHVIFTDFEKAFDRLNHDFMIELLKHRNFGENFTKFILTYLKGKSRIIFNGYKSDYFQVDRSTPQGETLSPILFTLAMDVLIRSVLSDPRIKGVKLIPKSEASKYIKENCIIIKGYADDLYFSTEDPQDIIYFLEHIKRFEEASNSKLCLNKCELLSFGENKPNEIQNISQANHEVRCLGVYFNQNGVINKIDETHQKAIKTLEHIKKFHPKFKAKGSHLKSYYFSKFYHIAPFTSINNTQAKEIQNAIRWFLFHDDIKYNDEICYSAKISKKRLSQKSPLGLNIPEIQEIFDASKAKFLYEANNNNKDWHSLLNILILKKFSTNPNKTEDIYPLFYYNSNNKITKVSKNSNWLWFDQGMRIYQNIQKNIKFTPFNKYYNAYNNKLRLTVNLSGIKNNLPLDDFYPISPKRTKCTDLKIWEKTELKIQNCTKYNKIKLSLIIQNSRKQNEQEIFSNTQKKWIEEGIDIKLLLKKKINTFFKINNYRFQCLNNYFKGITNKKCSHCGEIYDSLHILLKCSLIDKIEKEIDITGNLSVKRKNTLQVTLKMNLFMHGY